MKITRGEVPYERIKGRIGSLIDSPAITAIPDNIADAEWLIRTYEPRINLDVIDIDGAFSGSELFAPQKAAPSARPDFLPVPNGDFNIDAVLKRRGAGE